MSNVNGPKAANGENAERNFEVLGYDPSAVSAVNGNIEGPSASDDEGWHEPVPRTISRCR